MLRRDVLKTIGLAAGSIALGPDSFAAGDDLSVTVTVAGKTLLYSAATGKDLGDYKSPRFVQRCIRVDHPDSAHAARRRRRPRAVHVRERDGEGQIHGLQMGRGASVTSRGSQGFTRGLREWYQFPA